MRYRRHLLRSDGQVLFPMTPIYNAEIKRGQINVGVTPGTTPVAAYTQMTSLGSITDGDYLDNPTNVTMIDADTVATQSTGGSPDYCSIWDVSNPASISRLGETGSSDVTEYQGMVNVARYGTDYIVVENSPYFGYVHVVDISDTANPSIVGADDDGTNFFSSDCGMAVIGTNAFISSSGVLGTIDISTPASPSFTNVYSNAALNGANGQVPLLALTGNYLAVAGSTSLVILDVSTPTSPSIAATETDATYTDNVTGLSLSPDGNYLAILAADTDYLSIYDVSTPASPSRLGSVELTGTVDGVTVSGTPFTTVWVDANHVIATMSLRLVLADVSDKSNPALVDAVVDNGNPRSMCRLSDDTFAVCEVSDDTLSIYQLT